MAVLHRFYCIKLLLLLLLLFSSLTLLRSISQDGPLYNQMSQIIILSQKIDLSQQTVEILIKCSISSGSSLFDKVPVFKVDAKDTFIQRAAKI